MRCCGFPIIFEAGMKISTLHLVLPDSSSTQALFNLVILNAAFPLFLPILKENPKEAEIVSHRLMLRAGLIRQEAAGIYSWLPAGLRILKKVSKSSARSRTVPALSSC